MTEYGGHFLTNPYGSRGSAADGFHDGIDLRAEVGTYLYLPYDATLDKFSNSAYGWCYDASGIWHGLKVSCRFAHLSERRFADGDKVEAGKWFARTGGAPGTSGAGNSRGPHLHFEVRISGNKINPENYPGLCHAIFNGGLEMTKTELRQIVDEQVNQARDKILAEIAETQQTVRAGALYLADGTNNANGRIPNTYPSGVSIADVLEALENLAR